MRKHCKARAVVGFSIYRFFTCIKRPIGLVRGFEIDRRAA